MELLIEMLSEAGIRTSGQGPSAYISPRGRTLALGWVHVQLIIIYALGSLAGQYLSLSLFLCICTWQGTWTVYIYINCACTLPSVYISIYKMHSLYINCRRHVAKCQRLYGGHFSSICFSLWTQDAHLALCRSAAH